MFGCAGTALTADERAFFRDADPYGFIVFARNIADPGQVRALAAELRATVGRDAPVLVDQEGGRVARLKPPHWPAMPAARRIGELAERDPAAGRRAARLHAQAIGAMLADLTLTSACGPVADLLLPETHAVIGDRAYAADPALVRELAGAAIDGFLDAGILPIAKHMPGHGRATADSHLVLPVVDTPRQKLEETDFAAFRGLRAPWAMVAHVVYAAVDPERPASVSPLVIAQILRGWLGYDGVLIADDIGMQALAGGFAQRAAATLAAGCDLSLHCSGVMDEMTDAMKGVDRLTAGAAARLGRDWRGQAVDRHAPAPELDDARNRLAALLAA